MPKSRMPAVEINCDLCGRAFKKWPSTIREHNFCGKECSGKWLSERMSKMNRELNPERMTPQTRAKLRESRLGTGEAKTYAKTYGRHTHRVVAEQMLGRPLRQGEIVHHKNKDYRDNRPENLEVLSSQSEHARLHTRLKKEGDANAV